MTEDAGDNRELAELRRRLGDALARSGLTKTQLAARAGLGRTATQLAFQAGGPVPSAATVAALARVLDLPLEELLELRRPSVSAPRPSRESGPGPVQPIGMWDPHDLEVHPAGPAGAPAGRDGHGSSVQALPTYVRREHDEVLDGVVRDVEEGLSRMLVLVGGSSTGKTRACWEAVQPLTDRGWVLWHPFDPERAEAALEGLRLVRPRTVVWLNEAQHYLDDPRSGERIAAAVRRLLTDRERGPVLVLGTLWPEYADRYTAPPAMGATDQHSQVRELLAGRTLAVPGHFDTDALAAAAAVADGDLLLREALARAAEGGQVTQHLAGAPQLLERYQRGTPAARALLEVAMDARRLGVGWNLPHTFLTVAVADYLDDSDYTAFANGGAQAAFAELGRPVHGMQCPLSVISPRPRFDAPGTPQAAATPSPPKDTLLRLADYLDEQGRTTRQTLCPPSSFWYAAHSHLTRSEDLGALSQAAGMRHRLRWEHHLEWRAAEAGDANSLARLATALWNDGETQLAGTAFRRAAASGRPDVLTQLVPVLLELGWEHSVRAACRQAAAAGHPQELCHLAQLLWKGKEYALAEQMFREAASSGQPEALANLGWRLWWVGRRKEAEEALRASAAAGHIRALVDLGKRWWEAGDRGRAETAFREAAASGVPEGLTELARHRWDAGEETEAEAIAREATAAGEPAALVARLRKAGKYLEAEAACREAATAGHPQQLRELAKSWWEAGLHAYAESLFRAVAAAGAPGALCDLAWRLWETGQREQAEDAYQGAAALGDVGAWILLARRLWDTGQRDRATAAFLTAADEGNTAGLRELAHHIWQEDTEQAERLYRHAVDAGDADALVSWGRDLAHSGEVDRAVNVLRKAAAAGRRGLGDLGQELFDTDLEKAILCFREEALACDPGALTRLLSMLDRNGHRERRMDVVRWAVDAGYAAFTPCGDHWPHGLEPTGTPSLQWSRTPYDQLHI
ncbi:hypothetical protein [Streptomyces sp. NPDC019890]|uniref:hypothetical protein n=1 Tax=Streptomyces sp. NPDC019890 TaxID=3365064 RepID=UPI0038515367